MRVCDEAPLPEGVQGHFSSILNYKKKNAVGGTDYESKGRAFESLRVRHLLRVSSFCKKIFVPLILICTSFNQPALSSNALYLDQYDYKFWPTWSRPYAP